MDEGRALVRERRLRRGVADDPAVKAAALAYAYGGDGARILDELDPARAVVMQAVAVRAAELARQRDERLALLINAAVAGDRGAFRRLTTTSRATSTR